MTPVLATLILCATPQQVEIVEGQEVPILKYEDLSFVSYRPRFMTLDDLFNHASEFFRRDLNVDDHYVSNLVTLGDTILVYDTPQAAQRIVQDLREFDELLAEELQKPPDYLLMEYRPRGLSLNSLNQALSPFHRSIEVYDALGNGMSFDNVSVVEENGLLVLRDEPEMLRQMKDLLDRIDRPVPQVMLTCYVLRGPTSGEQAPGQAIPAELQRTLQALLPGTTLVAEALGMLRTTTAAGKELAFNMDGLAVARTEDGTQYRRSYRLLLNTGAFDANAGILNLEYCSFSLSDPMEGDREVFSTSTTIHSNEYAVLGVVGAQPLFIVLQGKPVTQAPM
ncbi:MAG: hypothetical protein EYC70_10820 [Planctomycetota bacterium]|nr:MAG: hypothetical protein EYC70_10820 [Planctomycetota bacterium]